MKKGFYTLLALLMMVIGLSCNNNKSYTDMLNDQRKAIRQYLNENNIRVLDDYPSDGVFKANEYVRFSNGVYMNVVDSGNGVRATAYQTNVLCRFQGHYLLSDTLYDYTILKGLASPIDITRNGYQPMEFTFGSLDAESVINYYYNCEGISLPLAYVGDSSIVNLIVPFTVGSQYAASIGDPVVYENVRFIFEK